MADKNKNFYPSPRETFKDLAGMFGSLGRGATAATLGLPGDIAGLAHLLGNLGARAVGLPENPDLPKGALANSAYWKRVLPNLPESVRHEFAQDAGGFIPVNPVPAAKGLSMLGAEAIARGVEGSGPLSNVLAAVAPHHVVKPKGGNWLAGSVEDALKGLKHLNPAPDTPAAAVNSWIEGPLTKYVKTRMATPDDEVRKLAEQGVLHFDPEALGQSRDILLGNAVRTRRRAGMPITGMANTPTNPLAFDWENMADAAVGMSPAGTRMKFQTFREKNPWLEKLDPDTPTYHFSNPTGELGFPHLIDELSNALNPESGLPRNLLLTPEAVANMSMEKAVRRVADINAWRAALKAETNQKFGLLPPQIREYAENNPKGLRWLELKAPEPKPLDVTPEEVEAHYAAMGPERDKWIAEWRHRRDAFQKNEEGKKALAEQLKYEGDTMGHCVGGYCDDVFSGRSRIFSLRDAKGEPHVTIEVVPEQRRAMDKWAVREALTPEEATKYFAASNLPGVHDYKSQLEAAGLYDVVAERLGYNKPLGQTISQIKGKQNRAPNEEYLPFVQDFVRNPHTGQPWADVGDLGNTGLVDVSKLKKGFSMDLSNADYQRIVDALGPNQVSVSQTLADRLTEFPNYGTIDEIVSALNPIKKASGGSVTQQNPWASALTPF